MSEQRHVSELVVRVNSRRIPISVDKFTIGAGDHPHNRRYRAVSNDPYFKSLIGDTVIIVDISAGCEFSPKSSRHRDPPKEYLELIKGICDTVKERYTKASQQSQP